jgi:hypothetical protein
VVDGGGVTYWLRTGAHRFGLRVEVAASARSKSVAFVEKRRILSSSGEGIAVRRTVQGPEQLTDLLNAAQSGDRDAHGHVTKRGSASTRRSWPR